MNIDPSKINEVYKTTNVFDYYRLKLKGKVFDLYNKFVSLDRGKFLKPEEYAKMIAYKYKISREKDSERKINQVVGRFFSKNERRDEKIARIVQPLLVKENRDKEGEVGFSIKEEKREKRIRKALELLFPEVQNESRESVKKESSLIEDIKKQLPEVIHVKSKNSFQLQNKVIGRENLIIEEEEDGSLLYREYDDGAEQSLFFDKLNQAMDRLKNEMKSLYEEGKLNEKLKQAAIEKYQIQEGEKENFFSNAQHYAVKSLEKEIDDKVKKKNFSSLKDTLEKASNSWIMEADSNEWKIFLEMVKKLLKSTKLSIGIKGNLSSLIQSSSAPFFVKLQGLLSLPARELPPEKRSDEGRDWVSDMKLFAENLPEENSRFLEEIADLFKKHQSCNNHLENGIDHFCHQLLKGLDSETLKNLYERFERIEKAEIKGENSVLLNSLAALLSLQQKIGSDLKMQKDVIEKVSGLENSEDFIPEVVIALIEFKDKFSIKKDEIQFFCEQIFDQLTEKIRDNFREKFKLIKDTNAIFDQIWDKEFSERKDQEECKELFSQFESAFLLNLSE